MKAHTSIPFSGLSGSAGMVTARDTRFGTILSGRAQRSGKVTPQQKDMRAMFARVGRSFKRLSAEQVEAWSAFAREFDNGSGLQAKSPAVNAYVTLNCNRALLGLDMLKEPPAEMEAIPDVEYRNVIVTPGLIQFSRLVNPGAEMRLAVRMSAAASTGISQGAGLPVLLDAGFIPERSFADVTTVYTQRLGMSPEVGRKYFIETCWMSVRSGLQGPRRADDRICQMDL